jgi:hypothetical protein
LNYQNPIYRLPYGFKAVADPPNALTVTEKYEPTVGGLTNTNLQFI